MLYRNAYIWILNVLCKYIYWFGSNVCPQTDNAFVDTSIKTCYGGWPKAKKRKKMSCCTQCLNSYKYRRFVDCLTTILLFLEYCCVRACQKYYYYIMMMSHLGAIQACLKKNNFHIYECLFLYPSKVHRIFIFHSFSKTSTRT